MKHTMPFGKHVGRRISEVREDRQYCAWLCSQDWFAAKFPALHRRLAAEPVAQSGTVVPWEAIRTRFGSSNDKTDNTPAIRRRTRKQAASEATQCAG